MRADASYAESFGGQELMDVRWTFFGGLAFVSTRTEQGILGEWRTGERTAKSIVTTKNTEGTEFLDKKLLWTIGSAVHL